MFCLFFWIHIFFGDFDSVGCYMSLNCLQACPWAWVDTLPLLLIVSKTTVITCCFLFHISGRAKESRIRTRTMSFKRGNKYTHAFYIGINYYYFFCLLCKPCSVIISVWIFVLQLSWKQYLCFLFYIRLNQNAWK